MALTQQGQPVTYASRALTKAEQNYSQIAKELLAQVFRMGHNHQYVYGTKVTLWIDHKPLEMIAQKPLSSTPKRRQRLMVRLMEYDVEIKYRRGPEMYLADTLSRAYFPQTPTPGKSDEEVEGIHSVNFLPVSEPKIQEIRHETANDPVLQSVKAVILTGCIRDELAVQDDVIFLSVFSQQACGPRSSWGRINCRELRRVKSMRFVKED